MLPLGMRPLMSPDETRYAEIPREMRASGDWVVPRLVGLLYSEKPAGGYWIEAVTTGLLGDTPFAARLPSVLATLLVALLLLDLTRTGVRGDLAAALYLATGEVFVLGTFNVLDALFTAFLSAALIALYRAEVAAQPRRRTAWLAGVGVAAAAAFLVKGFLAFAVIGGAGLAFLLWRGGLRAFLPRIWLPALACLVVALPWSLGIAVREPRFWPRFFWVEHVARFFSGSGYHEGPWWLPTAFLLAGGLPVTALLPAAVLGLRRRGLGAPAVRFALCWLLVPLALVSASKGKLGTYVLPCFPPLALLVALALDGPDAPLRPARWGAWVLAGAAALGALGVALAQIPAVRDAFHPGAPALYGAGETWRLIGFVAGIAASAAAFAWAARGRHPARVGLRLAAAAAPIFLVASACLPQRVTEGHSPAPLLEEHRAELAEAAVLVSTSYDAPALALYARRSDILITGNPGELAWGLSFPAGLGRLVTPQDLMRRLATLPADASMVVLVGRGRFDEDLRPVLGAPARLARQRDFVLAQWMGRSRGSMPQQQANPLDRR